MSNVIFWWVDRAISCCWSIMLTALQWSENILWCFWQLLTLLTTLCDPTLAYHANFISCLVKTHTMTIQMNHSLGKMRTMMTMTFFLGSPANDPSSIVHHTHFLKVHWLLSSPKCIWLHTHIALQWMAHSPQQSYTPILCNEVSL